MEVVMNSHQRRIARRAWERSTPQWMPVLDVYAVLSSLYDRIGVPDDPESWDVRGRWVGTTYAAEIDHARIRARLEAACR